MQAKPHGLAWRALLWMRLARANPLAASSFVVCGCNSVWIGGFDFSTPTVGSTQAALVGQTLQVRLGRIARLQTRADRQAQPAFGIREVLVLHALGFRRSPARVRRLRRDADRRAGSPGRFLRFGFRRGRVGAAPGAPRDLAILYIAAAYIIHLGRLYHLFWSFL